MSQHTFIAQPDTVIIPSDYLRAYEKIEKLCPTAHFSFFSLILYLFYSVYDFELCRTVMKKLFLSIKICFQFLNQEIIWEFWSEIQLKL